MFSDEYGNLDDKISRVDFYGNDGVCLFKFFVTPGDPQRLFTLMILGISIVCFAIVTTAYIVINVFTLKSSRSLLGAKGPTANVVKKRNQKLQKKIATIIITDFLCWIPFILICFLNYFGVLDATPQYGLFSIIILSINSIINPYLYSELMQKCASKIWGIIIPFFEASYAKHFKKERDQQEERPEGQEAIPKITSISKTAKVEMIPMMPINQSPGEKAESIHQEKPADIVADETKQCDQIEMPRGQTPSKDGAKVTQRKGFLRNRKGKAKAENCQEVIINPSRKQIKRRISASCKEESSM